MSREDITHMAEQAGFEFTPEGGLILRGADWHTEQCVANSLSKFAALVAESERERILEICKDGLWDAGGIRAKSQK